MKRNVLLVSNSDNGLGSMVEEAARQSGRGLKRANSARGTFEILKLGLDDVDIVVVVIDASLHSLAIGDALSYCHTAPHVIALIEGDDTEATHIVQRHGTAACRKKSLGAEELARLMNKIRASDWQNQPLTCDKWGHVHVPSDTRVTSSLTPAALCGTKVIELLPAATAKATRAQSSAR